MQQPTEKPLKTVWIALFEVIGKLNGEHCVSHVLQCLAGMHECIDKVKT